MQRTAQTDFVTPLQTKTAQSLPLWRCPSWLRPLTARFVLLLQISRRIYGDAALFL
mgnify:CR=1 FL=1